MAQHLVMKPYIWSALSVHTHGMRNLDSLKPPFIVIANHSSHVDTTVIYAKVDLASLRTLVQPWPGGAA